MRGWKFSLGTQAAQALDATTQTRNVTSVMEVLCYNGLNVCMGKTVVTKHLPKVGTFRVLCNRIESLGRLCLGNNGQQEHSIQQMNHSKTIADALMNVCF